MVDVEVLEFNLAQYNKLLQKVTAGDFKKDDYFLHYVETMSEVLKKALPQEPVQLFDDCGMCNQCGEEVGFFSYNYCPNCGQRLQKYGD